MRRAAAGLPAFFLVTLLATPLLVGCGGNAESLAGLYWEPSSGRRVEIRQEGDEYWLFYGAAKQAHAARLEGDELVITDPLGGQTIVRKGDAEGVLELETAGSTTQLERLQQRE